MTSFGSRRILIDTSAVFALYVKNDRNHSSASSILIRLTSEKWELFTTNYVVAECHALLLNRAGRKAALAFLDGIEQRWAAVIRATPENEARAIDIIRRYTDKTFSFTDATSFAVAEMLNITTAFSFDADFNQYGMNVMKP